MRFGEYEVRVTPRKGCKRIILRTKPGEDWLNMSVPWRTTQRDILKFLEEHRSWIEAHAKKASVWTPAFVPGERHMLFGEYVTLGQGGVPVGEAFLTWRGSLLMERAMALIGQWAPRMGVAPRRIRLRDMSSRWGSCQTVTHDITLNARLGMKPQVCLEYVVVHELCHLIHPDHSPAFHAEMTRFLPDWKARRTLLNRIDTSPLPPER